MADRDADAIGPFSASAHSVAPRPSLADGAAGSERQESFGGAVALRVGAVRDLPRKELAI